MTPERQQIIPGLPFDEYKAIDAVNNTALVKLAEKGPGGMKHALEQPDDPTAAMIKGGGIDCLALEPRLFHRQYTTMPLRRDELPPHFIKAPPEMLGKSNAWLVAGKEWKAEQEAEGRVVYKASDWGPCGLSGLSDAGKAWKKYAGETWMCVLSRSDMADVRGAAAAVLAYEPAAQLIHEACVQDSIVWFDEETGLWCKGRTDLRLTAEYHETARATEPVVIDLKSLAPQPGVSVDPEDFGRYAFKRRIHWQLAYYCDGLAAITGEPHDDARIIAVEQAPPYRVEVYRLPLSILEQGRQEYRTILQMYAECKTNNHWPVSSGRELTLEFPAWATR
jgi:hypothetical protein